MFEKCESSPLMEGRSFVDRGRWASSSRLKLQLFGPMKRSPFQKKKLLNHRKSLQPSKDDGEDGRLKKNRVLPKTNITSWKNDGWKTTLSFLGPSNFSGAFAVKLQVYVCQFSSFHIWATKKSTQRESVPPSAHSPNRPRAVSRMTNPNFIH